MTDVARCFLPPWSIMSILRPSWCARRRSGLRSRSSASRTSPTPSASPTASAYGLSSGVCTDRLDYITRFVDEAAGRHRQYLGSAWLSHRNVTVRWHQGLRPRLQGRCAGGDEELHQREDVVLALAGLGTDQVGASRPWQKLLDLLLQKEHIENNVLEEEAMAETKSYSGSCHCGAVAYDVELDVSGAIKCNCSICEPARRRAGLAP